MIATTSTKQLGENHVYQWLRNHVLLYCMVRIIISSLVIIGLLYEIDN